MPLLTLLLPVFLIKASPFGQWLCPQCQTVFRAEVEVIADDDCRSQLVDAAPPSVEWFGVEGDRWYHARDVGFILRELGPVTTNGDTWSLAGALETQTEGLVSVTLHAEGRMEVGEVEGDPLFGMRPPESYACGWPQALSPPWGGPGYSQASTFDLDTMMGGLNGAEILSAALGVAPNVAYFLPKNVDRKRVRTLARQAGVNIEFELCELNGHVKGVVAYFGFDG